MENRIKRLEVEEERAHKKIKETMERTEKYEKMKNFKMTERQRLDEHYVQLDNHRAEIQNKITIDRESFKMRKN